METRLALEEYAKHERRTLGNLGEVLLEWALERLKVEGSTEKLLNRPVPIPRKHRERPREKSDLP